VRFDLLEKDIAAFPWELYIPYGRQIMFRSSSRKSMIYHTGKLEEIFSRGINSRLKDYENSCDTMDESARRPCTLHLRNDKDNCYVSFDASGEFLYKRGHRSYVSRAPLRESTAALILLEAKVERYSTILDPMCGSGTFSIEAAGILTGSPASPDRDFPFFYWPGFKEKNFDYIRNECSAASLDPEKFQCEIVTSDIDVKSLAAAKLNCEAIFPGLIKPEHKDFFEIKNPQESKRKTLLVLNPPYGRRMGGGEVISLYRKIGGKIRKDFKGCGFAIIAPGLEAEKALALDYHRKIPFMNGGIRSAVLFRDA
jgi:putative N6-adenine-specific DNA methylase